MLRSPSVAEPVDVSLPARNHNLVGPPVLVKQLVVPQPKIRLLELEIRHSVLLCEIHQTRDAPADRNHLFRRVERVLFVGMGVIVVNMID